MKVKFLAGLVAIALGDWVASLVHSTRLCCIALADRPVETGRRPDAGRVDGAAPAEDAAIRQGRSGGGRLTSGLAPSVLFYLPLVCNNGYSIAVCALQRL